MNYQYVIRAGQRVTRLPLAKGDDLDAIVKHLLAEGVLASQIHIYVQGAPVVVDAEFTRVMDLPLATAPVEVIH